MMKLWALISLACMFLAQPGNALQPTDVIVRLVYLDNGKPAGNQQISLYEGKPSLASTVRFRQMTGSDGITKFRVSPPLPDKLWVSVDSGSVTGCAWEDMIPLREILDAGVTIGRDKRFGSECKGSQNTITHLGAKPGEVVIFVRKVSVWDNLRHY